jgi:small conductance mechanosensitive channel
MLEDKAQNVMADMGALLPLIVTNALNALGAILILLIGLWLLGRADRLVARMLRRTPHVDPMLQSFFGSLARYLVLTVTVLAVLSEFGIQTTSLVAILGAASLAVGLALQGTLSNLAAGIMLLIFRPFRIGSQGADRRQQRGHRQRAVTILDGAGHRRQSAGNRAKQRCLGPAFA